MFALDIGTRFIVGIISEMTEDGEIIIENFAVKEHENRAMLDGQIHDVTKVSKGVEKIIKQLKENIDDESKIKNVAVALAGRFLVTTIGEYEMEISNMNYIDYNTVKTLELEAVKDAVKNLEIEKNFYCVGYSVLYYEIDGEWIKKLEGQKGEKAKAKVIAAFLPKNVVDAMLAVLELNDLEPVHITLEPIAAMNLIVPEDLRTLNIAMVDVGAGTSDIAIAKDGTIIGYGMVPMAGDEISEAISKELLVDFKTAERLKRELNNQEKDVFTYKDILDFEQEISKEKILEIIEPVVEEITSKIAEKILELNGKPPIAVMVVGGGGKVPQFIDKLALKLNLSRNRITLKDIKNIEYVEFLTDETLEGSEFITPVGIAYVAHKNEGNVFARIIVNDKPINMMLVGGELSVMQVLLQAGFGINDIVGKPAPAISYEINGELKFLPGEKGKEAPIKINGKEADLKSPVKPGDVLEVGKPQDGKIHYPTVKEIIKPYKIFIDGELYSIYPRVYKNNEEVNLEDIVHDGDKFEIRNPLVKELKSKLKSKTIKFSINDKFYEIPVGKVLMRKNEILNDFDEIYDNDKLYTQMVEVPLIKDFIDVNPEKVMSIVLNGSPIELPLEEIIVKDREKRVNINSKVYDDMHLKVEKREKEIRLLDLFTHIDFDVSNFTKYKIYINNKEIFSFNEKLNPGDEIRMEFE
ncbi:cell division protein FtsA [Marinitoga sp. 1135]|uniref:Actin-like ATPase involved in cell division n=1 Tax=Marinitoga piezophila (strain DSM 14283 / JCM 11233 / KA3) TaxID=443254 RepID=H2J3P2_MARPK|nr:MULTISPECIES: cell division FtsA domain-containing protein [Marinitoga]AEX84686.1 actin-like ATPase involved in cell division [Marinitoga piezophila KA3]APT75213.1 cell division protein FtsA [Marinitoga sp. 1137]NUU94995.1 cell division protein FtsA [Marinitoga sp. 1135]NUU96951.1 cell division protein FtsA [Marinitoga sp. 1138]